MVIQIRKKRCCKFEKRGVASTFSLVFSHDCDFIKLFKEGV